MGSSLDMAPDTLTADSRLTISAGVVFSEIDGETVLLSAEAGKYYGLDEIGTRIWMLLQEDPRLGGVHARLSQEYEAPTDRLWDDLVRLVTEMRTNGLVEVDVQQDM